MANTYPEPYRSAKKGTLVDPSTCYNRHCTSYCAWKIKEATGKWPKRTGDMDARNWIYRLPENGYGTKTSAPNGNKCVGVRTSGKYGHVVWSDGSLYISEYNWDSRGNYSERNVHAADYQWFIIKGGASGFLPARGYWKYGDKDARIGQMARFMRDKFPAYTPAAALGNYFGPNLLRAVKEFQRRAKADGKYNDAIDGNVGPKTYAALKQYGFTG